uniref:J domain-containing protein n=1 Tax=Tetraselmis sp. GSL018 TaxID=582737 RepID=A0A061SNB6_9CHLO
MLRQASEDADGPLLDEDLRRKLADAAHEWEVERVLMCETPHEVLRVSEDATPTDVKHAFRRLSTLIHPDRNRSRNASQAMQTVTAAFRSMYLSSTPAENTAGSNEPHAKKKHTAKKPMRPRPVYQRSSSMNSETSRFSKKSEGVSCRYDGPQAPRWGWNS